MVNTPEELVGKYLVLPDTVENKEAKVQGRVAHIIGVVDGKLKVIVGAREEHVLSVANVTGTEQLSLPAHREDGSGEK